MVAKRDTLDLIKQDLEACVGKHVKLWATVVNELEAEEFWSRPTLKYS